MTATEEVRHLLDERGVEWDASDTYRLLVTSWKDANGHSWAFMEHRDGSFSKLTAYHLTAKQAVEATLGRGTCHTVTMDCFGNPPYNTSGLNGNSTACGCSECGAPWSTMGVFRGNQLKHNFKACPICGREVVGK